MGGCAPFPPDSNDESDTMDSRAPSPWQDAYSRETEHFVTISIWQTINRLGREFHRLEPETGSLESSGLAEGIASCASGSSSSRSGSTAPADSNLWGFNSSSLTASNDRPRSKRPRNENEQAGDSDNEDDRPGGKRANIAAPEERLARPRFACPYQKYDPLGSPFCCMPNTKNPEGGADTFARIKFHILRNHDPFTRCPNCWKACKTEEEAVGHKDSPRCIGKASPGKYWMTGAQRLQVRGQKFVANSVDNWFCLFGILLPNAYPDGTSGQRRPSPCRWQDGVHRSATF